MTSLFWPASLVALVSGCLWVVCATVAGKRSDAARKREISRLLSKKWDVRNIS